MAKHTVFTNVTPLPRSVTRDTAVATLHDHVEMITLNPLVIKHQQCPPPRDAPADEYHCVWYELTDKVQYLPGGLLSGNVSYKVCFHDLPRGLQTHCYAPAGLDIKGKWSVGGNMPGEPRETMELGINAPREGLYLREDVSMRCNVLMTSFVKKTLQKAHSVLVDRLMVRTDIEEEKKERASMAPSYQSQLHPGGPGMSREGSIMSGQMPYSPTHSDFRTAVLAAGGARSSTASSQPYDNPRRNSGGAPRPVPVAELPTTTSPPPPIEPYGPPGHRYASSMDSSKFSSTSQGVSLNDRPAAPSHPASLIPGEKDKPTEAPSDLAPAPLRPRSGRHSQSLQVGMPADKFELE